MIGSGDKKQKFRGFGLEKLWLKELILFKNGYSKSFDFLPNRFKLSLIKPLIPLNFLINNLKQTFSLLTSQSVLPTLDHNIYLSNLTFL
jgi:hypothetical protein